MAFICKHLDPQAQCINCLGLFTDPSHPKAADATSLQAGHTLEDGKLVEVRQEVKCWVCQACLDRMRRTLQRKAGLLRRTTEPARCRICHATPVVAESVIATRKTRRNLETGEVRELLSHQRFNGWLCKDCSGGDPDVALALGSFCSRCAARQTEENPPARWSRITTTKVDPPREGVDEKAWIRWTYTYQGLICTRCAAADAQHEQERAEQERADLRAALAEQESAA